LVVDSAAYRGSVELALVALVTESKVDILAVATEPVTDSLGVAERVNGLPASSLLLESADLVLNFLGRNCRVG